MTTKCVSGSGSNCDPKLLVSFIGTDKNNRYMKSAGMRMSQFNKYSINSIYQSTGVTTS